MLIKNASITLTNFLDDIWLWIENEGRILIQSHYNDESRRDIIYYSHYSVRDEDFLIRAQPPLWSATGSNIAAVGGRKGGWGKLGNSHFQLILVFHLNDQVSGILYNPTEFSP